MKLSQETVNELLANKDNGRKIAEALLPSSKPESWGRRSNAPYFKEKYAKEVQSVLDKLMEDKQPVVYSYRYFGTKFGYSPNTLYLRIYQGIRFLLRYMDPEKKYFKLMQHISLSREKGKGVFLRWIGEDTMVIRTEDVEFQPKDEVPHWKVELQRFLEDDTIKEFVRERLYLSPEDVQQTKITVAQLENVAASITSYSIKLVRL